MRDVESEVGWQDVPTEAWGDWVGIFDRSQEGLDLAAACPVCKAHELHCWFDLHRREPSEAHGRVWAGTGSGWQWCSNCKSYAHFRALVPAWWREDTIDVDRETLRHDPGPIEQARLLSRGR